MSPSISDHGVSSAAHATASQLRYLRALAQQTATTFAYPASRRDASREITRLERLQGSGRTPSSFATRRDDQPPVYATAVQPDEVSGYGSSARWRHSRPAATDLLLRLPDRAGDA